MQGAATPPATGKGSGKRRGGLLNLVADTVASHAARLRDLEGAQYDVVLLPSTSPIVAKISEVGKNYHFTAEERRLRRQDGMATPLPDLGPLHVHTYAALLETLAAGHDNYKDDDKTTIKKTKTTYDGYDLLEMCGEIRQCRLAKCYDQQKTKLQLCIGTTADRNTVLRCLQAHGGEVKMGRAPPSGRDRELSRLLSELTLAQ
jgi:hypothetical protein